MLIDGRRDLPIIIPAPNALMSMIFLVWLVPILPFKGVHIENADASWEVIFRGPLLTRNLRSARKTTQADELAFPSQDTYVTFSPIIRVVFLDACPYEPWETEDINVPHAAAFVHKLAISAVDEAAKSC